MGLGAGETRWASPLPRPNAGPRSRLDFRPRRSSARVRAGVGAGVGAGAGQQKGAKSVERQQKEQQESECYASHRI